MAVAEVQYPHAGVQTWRNQHGIDIFQLHYSADEDKSRGDKIHVEALNMDLSPWAFSQYEAMTDKAAYRQEFEIDFAAKLGTLLYQFDEEATCEPSFRIPPVWTRYYGLDPHPVVPHASLWGATDPWGDVWIYRELWPSRIYGKPGNVPEDDNRYTIKEYVEAVKWLESKLNTENQDADEKIYKRVIDYSARTFGQGMDETDPQRNFQDRFEECGLYPFEDAIKDHETGIASVNEWLKPRQVEQQDGTFKNKSRLHIFKDKCPELIWQLKNNRYQTLTPLMAERQDPTGKPVLKRNHLTDILRYLCMSGLQYVNPQKPRNDWKPLIPGIAY